MFSGTSVEVPSEKKKKKTPTLITWSSQSNELCLHGPFLHNKSDKIVKVIPLNGVWRKSNSGKIASSLLRRHFEEDENIKPFAF